MLQPDKWPFIPERLSDIIDRDTLAVIEAGCCARIGRSITIVDINPSEDGNDHVNAVLPRQHFEPFCAFLRNEDFFAGGNAACEECDARIAREIARQTAYSVYRPYHCHMGLLDSRYVVEVYGRPVAALFCGQHRPPEGIEGIQQNVSEIGTGRFAHIVPINDKIKRELLMCADNLTPTPLNFPERLRREAEHIQRIAEAQYQQIKNKWEQAFLERLRATQMLGNVHSLEEIQQKTQTLLEQVRIFCGCRYVVLYANVQGGDTVLTPIAYAGISNAMGQQLPHFNWKKAELPLQYTGIKQWDIADDTSMLLRGIRGANSDYFADLGYVTATMLGNTYRGILVFGPFVELVDLPQEQAFLLDISRILGWAVHTDIQFLDLHNKQKQWESTAMLLTHQVRTAITPIATQIGIVKTLMRKPQTDPITTLINNSLKGAHELCLRLGATVKQTVKSHVLLLEPEDLEFERYPLSVLVANCAEAFIHEAGQRQRTLIVEDNVERLPQAEIDIARLTIAFSNLIDNAIKYSYPNTKIYIRGALLHEKGPLDLEHALIEIQNDGDKIEADKRERIFEQGERGLTGAKLRRIPGTGLGLWETRIVIEAHGGKIEVRNMQASHNRLGQAHRVIFTIKLPLRQT